MLRAIEHPDGGPWTGTRLARATDGEVSPSYFTALRDGAIDVPRADKLEAIARAMGFSPALWFRDLAWWEAAAERRGGAEPEAGDGASEAFSCGGEPLAALLKRLFELRRNEETGEPFTNREIAHLSGGAVSEEDLRDMRSGRLENPTWRQVLAVCDAFGVSPSYFAGPELAWVPPPGMLDEAEDRDSYVTFRNSLKLSRRDRGLLRTLSEQLRREDDADAR